MKNFRILTLIVLTLAISLSSCSKDDTEDTFVEFGTISININITEGSADLTKTLVVNAAPTNSIVTYANNGEEFNVGPEETVQSDSSHSLTTTNDASNLNVGLIGIVLDAEEIDVAYTITVTFNGSQIEKQDFIFQSNGFTHTIMYSTKNGFSENLVNP